jgi:hypothetical protein
MASGVTQIDKAYLTTLAGQLDTLLGEVKAQIAGLGQGGAKSGTLNFVPAISSTSLEVQAGSKAFNAGTVLNDALDTMGGSVAQQLAWLEKVLTDMINEIHTTIMSFTGTESLNNESVDQLITQFQNTINDVNTPPGGSNSGSTTTPPPTNPNS